MAGLLGDIDLGAIVQGGVETMGILDQIDRVRDIGDQAQSGMLELGDQAVEGTAFKPFGVVAGGLGSADTAADGSVNFTLDPTQQAQMDARLAQSNEFYNRASGGTNELMTQRLEEILAAQDPRRQQARLALESRLASQGRLGVGGQYGNPEMLAMYEANRRADLDAVDVARSYAQSQQAQDANLGGLFQDASLAPTRTLADLLQVGQRGSELAQKGQLAGQNFRTQAGVTGLEAAINAEKVATEGINELYRSGASLAGNATNSILGAITGSGSDGGSGDFIDRLIEGSISEWF